ncbi:alpha/beta fold hydrolase [Nocardioides sp. SYSU D00065]|uniref:alpha/beta fold hydrolase n=1 Tax=Nocardioides sp. SYSU D00065 TaxID=2817378 RepID=UPI001B31DDF0|nr:alpha/beta hydrolase [Nocardioides sp. SYSU D00065]
MADVRSLLLDVDGPVHVTDFGGSRHAPVVLCVHGLGGSSSVWRTFADAVGPSLRVLAIDLPGHGRSPAQGRTMSVAESARVLEGVIDELQVGPVVLVGHSMGAAVSMLTAASAPSSVSRLLLLAPPAPRDGARLMSPALIPHVAVCLWPRVGLLALQRRLSRQSLEDYVWDRFRLTCASVTGLSEVVEAVTAEMQAAYDGGEDPLAGFIRAARSVGMLVAGGRGYRDVISRVDQPVRIVHGALDRVLDPGGLEQLTALRPHWRTHLLPQVGHSPHLEEPSVVASLLRDSGTADEPASEPASQPMGSVGAPLAAPSA